MLNGENRHRLIAALLVAAIVGAGGCDSGARRPLAIDVDAPAALTDQPVHMTISGLAPRETVTVSATASDRHHEQWRSRGTFRADAHGALALDHARPISGTYASVDGMGLFWSMIPASGDPERSSFVPAGSPANLPPYAVRVTATARGHRPAARTLTRRLAGTGVVHRSFTVASDKISGEFFRPADRAARRPAVLLFGGSEGGDVGVSEAALLASHGFPALSIAYFRAPGLPPTLRDVPLEYFARAARLLAAQPGVNPAEVAVQGYSRGSEAALLLGQHYPGLIHGASSTRRRTPSIRAFRTRARLPGP